MAHRSTADPESDRILRNEEIQGRSKGSFGAVGGEDQAWLFSYPSLERGQEGWELLRVTMHSVCRAVLTVLSAPATGGLCKTQLQPEKRDVQGGDLSLSAMPATAPSEPAPHEQSWLRLQHTPRTGQMLSPGLTWSLQWRQAPSVTSTARPIPFPLCPATPTVISPCLLSPRAQLPSAFLTL